MLREGSLRQDLEGDAQTDDKARCQLAAAHAGHRQYVAGRREERGHMDHVVRRAIAFGHVTDAGDSPGDVKSRDLFRSEQRSADRTR